MNPLGRALIVGLVVVFGRQAIAHDLPISRLQLVADEGFLHLELALNSSELVFARELDRDKNGRLEVAEVNDQGDLIAQRVVECLRLESGGRTVAPDVMGIVPDVDTHHLTVRAHYPIDVRRAPITVECRLWETMRGAHTTEVTFRTPARRQSARLDARSPRVTFNHLADSSLAPVSTASSPAESRLAPFGALPLAVFAAMALLFGGYVIILRFRKLGN